MAIENSRKPTNLSLDSALLVEAKKLKVNLSRAAETETGVRLAVIRAQSEKWKAENAEALESSTTFVTKHGLPLQKFRQF